MRYEERRSSNSALWLLFLLLLISTAYFEARDFKNTARMDEMSAQLSVLTDKNAELEKKLTVQAGVITDLTTRIDRAAEKVEHVKDSVGNSVSIDAADRVMVKSITMLYEYVRTALHLLEPNMYLPQPLDTDLYSPVDCEKYNQGSCIPEF